MGQNDVLMDRLEDAEQRADEAEEEASTVTIKVLNDNSVLEALSKASALEVERVKAEKAEEYRKRKNSEDRCKGLQRKRTA